MAKSELWKKYGLLTDSDAAFLASRILVDQTFGPTVRKEVLRRFRLIIVDELQDTGWFLGHCVLQLLAEPSVRGVLVLTLTRLFTSSMEQGPTCSNVSLRSTEPNSFLLVIRYAVVRLCAGSRNTLLSQLVA